MTLERLQQLARRCRELSSKSVVPEVKEQLATWAMEFEAEGNQGALLLADKAAIGELNEATISLGPEPDGST